jgi:hypothetical protein
MAVTIGAPIGARVTLVSVEERRTAIYIAALAFLAAYFMVWPVWRSQFLIEIWPTESWNAYWQDAAAAGQNIYPDQASLTVNNYTPLSFYFVGLLAKTSGIDSLFVGRALSLIALAIISAEVFLAVRAITRDAASGLIAGLWYLAIMARNSTTYIGANDPQLVAQAIMGAALVWFLLRNRDGRSVYLPLLLMVLAGFWKHNTIGIPITALIWSFITCGRRAILPAAASAAACGAGLIVCMLVFGDAFLLNMLTPRHYGWTNVLTNIGHLQWCAPALVLWLAWAVQDRSDAAIFTALHVTVSLFACVLQWFGHGVGGNAEFDLIIALGIGIGVSLSRIDSTWFSRRFGAIAARDAVIMILVLRLLVADRQETALLFLSDRFAASVKQSEANLLSEAHKVRAIQGEVACAVKLVCRVAGKKFVVDEFKMEELVATGRATTEDVAEIIRRNGISSYVSHVPTGENTDKSILRWVRDIAMR